MTANNTDYSERNIQVLEGLSAVRHRPSMYIGDIGATGLHHLVYEVIDNSIDEAMAGRCDHIRVILRKDGSCTIKDNGSGIPVNPMQHKNPDINGKPAVEICMTVLHAGGKFDKNSYKVSGGLHGVGVSVVNALSSKLQVNIRRDGHRYEMKFEEGRVTQKLKNTGTSSRTGTEIRFTPDPKIFQETTKFSYSTLENRLRELAFLNDKLKIDIEDERNDRKESFCFSNGIKSYLEYLNADDAVLHKPIVLQKEDRDSGLQLAIGLQYAENYSTHEIAFANNIRNIDGGTHLSGFRTALTRAINGYAKKNNLLKKNLPLTGDDIREGVTAVVTVRVPEPQFEAQTKVRLMNADVGTFVETEFNALLSDWLECNPPQGKAIVGKAIRAASARIAAKKAREVARKSALSTGGMLPSKLWDCSSRNREETEIYLVEGDSAAGPAKQGRDSKYQAILPLRGKGLNVEKARIDQIYKNKELTAIITALGCGIGKDVNIAKFRYGKVIIMTDADVDGSHIRTLLLTFFYRYMFPLIEQGKIYIVEPPLYYVGIKGKKDGTFLKDDLSLKQYHNRLLEEEKNKLDRGTLDEPQFIQKCKESIQSKLKIKRFKGLGEMNADELWETALNPGYRTLKRISLSDITKEQDAVQYAVDLEVADRLFKILMGTNVEERRKYIEKNALSVSNLDI